MIFERANESNSDAFADAFADEKIFSDDAVDAINCNDNIVDMQVMWMCKSLVLLSTSRLNYLSICFY